MNFFILEFTFLNQNCVFEQITVTPFHEVDFNSNHAKLKIGGVLEDLLSDFELVGGGRLINQI